MKINRITLLLTVAGFLLYGCGGEVKEKVEYKKTFHRNGKVKEITPYVNGKAHGLKLEYYDDGAIRMEIPYDSSFVHGVVKFYYPDGKLYSEIPRVKGKINGVVKKYHKNGALHSETPYENDKPIPGLKEYNQQGVLLEQPKLVFSTNKEKRGSDLSVSLEVKFSTGIKSAKFFQGIFSDDGKKRFVAIPTTDGVGQISTILPKGSSIDKELVIRGEFVTKYKNRCVVEETYKLNAIN